MTPRFYSVHTVRQLRPGRDKARVSRNMIGVATLRPLTDAERAEREQQRKEQGR